MTIAPIVTRLNIGSGRYPIAGWVNIDMHCPADVEADFRDLHYQDVDEIRMSHLLEHISWRETIDVLTRLRTWLRPGGWLQVEVPDMDEILKLGTAHPLWFKYVYGDQSHPGEYHVAGFTEPMLAGSLRRAGFQRVLVNRFVSSHPGREGMPCLEGEASA